MIELSDLVSDDFIQRHTKFTSLNSFLVVGRVTTGTAISSLEWDAFIAERSVFATRKALLGAAAHEHMAQVMDTEDRP